MTLGGVNTPEYTLLFTKTKIHTSFAKTPFGDFDNETLFLLRDAIAAEKAQGKPAVVLAHHPLGLTSIGFGTARPTEWLGVEEFALFLLLFYLFSIVFTIVLRLKQ